MNQSSNTSPLDNDLQACPIPATHRRLQHSHMLWHQAMEHYHEAEQFQANLNATIEALRNVSFVLQSEKAAFGDFDQWYGPWRKRLQDDPTCKWLNDARVMVVHQKDLDSYSFAEIRLVTSGEEVVASVPIPIQTPSGLILENPALLHLLNPSTKDAGKLQAAALLIERRWSTEELQGREILSALAHVYGLLADIVLSAHSHLRRMGCIPFDSQSPDFPSLYDRTGVLRCMYAGTEARTERFNLSTREPIAPHPDSPPTVNPEDAVYRYGLDQLVPIGEIEQQDPLTLAKKFLHIAKRIVVRDKHHERTMFLRDGRGKWQSLVLVARDRMEKHVLMQLVAQLVEAQGCDAIIEISELWSARVSQDTPPTAQDVESIPGRTEELAVMVATRDGFQRMYLTPIKRGRFGGIKLGDTTQVENQHLRYLRPVIEVWIKQQKFRTQDGSESRVWEPDALDLCPCGGPNRYGECCKVVRAKHGRDSSSPKIRDALTRADFIIAEEIARASLAQYVIWIKQHTATAMLAGHAGKDFYDKIVNIDVLALESHVHVMMEVLSVANKKELILPQLRRLRELVGVPRIAMRLTAIAARWLIESDRYEEAVLELDALGKLPEVKDSLALSLVARNKDLPDPEKREAFTTAVRLAACDEEEHFANLQLASYLAENGELTDASAIVRSVIKETEREHASAVKSEALILLWRITGAEADFRPALLEMETDDDEARRYGNAVYLIDGAKYAEAESLLASLISRGDVQAKLLITDARIRSGARESAAELFNTIQPDEVPQTLRCPYAVAMSLLVLAGGFVNLRGKAISLLEGLPPAGGEQDKQIKSFLQLLS